MIRTAAPVGAVLIPVPRRADSPASFLSFLNPRRLRGSISPTAVTAIASAIQTQEGYYPGSVAWTNNNPGNLVYVGQPGAFQGSGGFARFNSYTAGRSALENQITLDAVRGTDANGNPINNVSDLIGSWAPASDPRNNTPVYIASVAAQTGYDPTAPLSSLGDAISSPSFRVDSVPAFASVADLAAGTASAGFDLSAVTSPTVDLSGVGLSSSVPLWWLGAGILGLALVRR
jgi:hypothetical protein